MQIYELSFNVFPYSVRGSNREEGGNDPSEIRFHGASIDRRTCSRENGERLSYDFIKKVSLPF